MLEITFDSSVEGCKSSSCSTLTHVTCCLILLVLQLECLRKWREGRNRYVIARPLGGDFAGQITCFVSVNIRCNILLSDRSTLFVFPT